MAQWVSRVRTEALLGWHSAGTDKLWAAAMTDRPLKPLVDITVQNTALHHMKYVAVEPAGVETMTPSQTNSSIRDAPFKNTRTFAACLV